MPQREQPGVADAGHGLIELRQIGAQIRIGREAVRRIERGSREPLGLREVEIGMDRPVLAESRRERDATMPMRDDHEHRGGATRLTTVVKLPELDGTRLIAGRVGDDFQTEWSASEEQRTGTETRHRRRWQIASAVAGGEEGHRQHPGAATEFRVGAAE